MHGAKMIEILNKRKNPALGVLFFGSVWGMIEATLGIFLHMMHFPHKGAVMFSIGSFLILMAIRMYRPKNAMKFTLGIGLIASLLKGFDIFLIGPEMMVIRPMIAIIIESLAFGATYKAIEKVREVDLMTSPLIGVLFAYVSYLGFGLVFAYMGIGSKFWLNKTIPEFIQMIASDGTYAAIICAMTSTLGYWVGETLRVMQMKLTGSRFFYPGFIAIILVFWIIGIGAY